MPKYCIEEECKKRSTFNYEGESQAIYCASHKKEGMVDVKHKTCQEPDCKKQPVFNYEGESQGIYCASHKKEGMVDVISKTCQEDNCKTRPTFNYEGKSLGIYCAAHKKEGMVNVRDKTCKTPFCSTLISNKQYQGYCLRCFMYNFPDKPVARNYKTKEASVAQFIQSHFSDFTWNVDKRVSDGCSSRRPDLLLDLGYQVVIIEIDENQHQSYDCSCENKRTMELSRDLGHRPIIFIRFNPDDYKDGAKNITSCWSVNGKGIIAVKKTKVKEWNDRLNILKSQVEYWSNPENKTEKTVEIVQLFYDI